VYFHNFILAYRRTGSIRRSHIARRSSFHLTILVLFYSHDDAWYNKQAFAKDKGEVGWQLVRKAPIVDSTNKTWNEQQALLSKDEETPKAQVVVYTIIGHFLATGERLLENIYVRTSSLDSGGDRVNVGNFDAKGLNVNNWNDDNRNDNIGLSAARQSHLHPRKLPHKREFLLTFTRGLDPAAEHPAYLVKIRLDTHRRHAGEAKDERHRACRLPWRTCCNT